MSEHPPDRTHPTVTLADLSAAGMSYALLQSMVAPATRVELAPAKAESG